MGKEIERKYLVSGEEWKELAEGIEYRQGYLSTVKERTVRVRTIGNAGYLTIKGITSGASRLEYEYEISVSDANEMLDQLCERPLIEKKRYKIENELIESEKRYRTAIENSNDEKWGWSDYTCFIKS